MEKIDLNNYEAWILDYLEGNLSEKEIAILMIFLDEHSELKEEVELDLSEVMLSANEDEQIDKTRLLVDQEELLITRETVDDLMISAVESELSPKEKHQLEQYITEHDLTKDYKAYKSTKLIPDLSEMMEGKEKMKIKPVIIPLYARIASFAAVGIVLIGFAWNNFSSSPVRRATSNSDAAFAESLDKLSHETNYISGNRTNNFTFHVQPIDKNDTSKSHNNSQIVNPGDLIVEEVPKDTIEFQKPPEIKFVPEPDKDDAVIAEKIDSVTTNNQQINDDLAIVKTRKEEPYKLITDAAGNFLNKDVSFTRDKNLADDQYVAYSFKLGKFEFERKKSK